MKVCFFLGTASGKGGVERVCTSIANALAERGYEVIVLSLWNGTNPTYQLNDKIKKRELFQTNRNFKLNYLSTIIRLRTILKEERVQVLIDADTILSIFSIPASLKLNVKRISWEHFNFNVSFGLGTRRIARKIAARFNHAIVTLTQDDVVEWKKRLPYVKDRITCIANPSPFNVRQGDRQNESSKIVLAVGRLTHQKGFDILLDIWKVFKEREEGNSWMLRIVGDGEEKLALEKKIADLGLLDSVQLVNFSSNVQDEYNSADIYVLTSRFEGLVMTLIESQTLGLPAIAFDCETGPRQIILDNTSGYLVAVGDNEKFVGRLMELAENSSLRQEMGRKAADNARRFAIENISEKWEKLINNL